LTANEALASDRAATGTEGPQLADLFIVSDVSEIPAAAPDARRSEAYPGLLLEFRKAPGRRCDRCWKVTPQAEESGLCDRCRRVLKETA